MNGSTWSIILFNVESIVPVPFLISFNLSKLFFVILMFVLSIINLKGALTKTDIMVIGIKEMTFVSALADAVIIQEFLYKVIPYYRDLPFMRILNSYFPLIIAVAMIMVPIYMFKRFRQYEA